MKPFLSIGACLVSVGAALAAPAPLDNWTWVNPQKQLSSWVGVAYGNGRYVTIGGDTGVAWSSDGIRWRYDGDFGIGYHRLFFAEGRFWAAGGDDDASASIISSTNGIDWQLTATGPHHAEYFTAFEYSKGTWLAQGGSEDGPDVIIISTNGANWTELAPTPPLNKFVAKEGRWVGFNVNTHGLMISSNAVDWIDIGPMPNLQARDSISDLVVAKGLFFAYGIGQRTTPQGFPYIPFLAWSADGVTWSNAVLPAAPSLDGSFVKSIACGPDGCVALLGRFSRTFYDTISSEILASPDGVAWERHSLPVTATLNAISFAGDRYFITGAQGLLLSSKNGLDWTRVMGSSTRPLHDLAANGPVHVAVGESGLLLTSRNNGLSWHPRDQVTTEDLWAVAEHRGRFVAVGGETAPVVITGDRNAGHWNETIAAEGAGLRGVVVNGKELLAVGLKGTVARLRGTFLDVEQVAGDPDFRGVTKLNNELIAIAWPEPGYPYLFADSHILSSSDGANWAPRLGQTNLLTSIAANDHTAVVVGTYNTVLVSTNGTDWMPAELPASFDNLYSVKWGHGIFVAAGLHGAIYSSTDGMHWAVHSYGSYPIFDGVYPNIWLATTLYGETPWIAFGNQRLFTGPGLEYIWRSSKLPHQVRR